MHKNNGRKLFGKFVRAKVMYQAYDSNTGIDTWKVGEGMISGVYIGTRTVWDGSTEWDDRVFIPAGHQEVGLVVPSWRRNPVRVDLASCVILPVRETPHD